MRGILCEEVAGLQRQFEDRVAAVRLQLGGGDPGMDRQCAHR
ncbi:Uncharacterised protein [Mycobacteroides abscessus subsp. abscessus]|nr:Uncharacterised protein [Mycobacteroides abscessus subsp. abscessus]